MCLKFYMNGLMFFFFFLEERAIFHLILNFQGIKNDLSIKFWNHHLKELASLTDGLLVLV